MRRMPSFDIVSRTDLQEVDNAVNGVRREIAQRFDFKGSRCAVERKEGVLTLLADDDFKLRQMRDLLNAYCARRKIDLRALDFREPESAAGGSLRQAVAVRQGVDQEAARAIVKKVKAAKMKVQVAVQGDRLRVSGKKRDDLQAAISLCRALNLPLALQFENMRD